MSTFESYRKANPVSYSAIEEEKIALTQDKISTHGVFFGGILLQAVDEIARKVAFSHAGFALQDAGVDFVRYYHPVKKNDILFCFAAVNRAWDCSLEVGVKVMAEDFRMLEKKKILSAYFTFVVKEESKQELLASIFPQTEREKRRFFDAETRKLYREGALTAR